jgi:hypothetical protein
MLTFVNKKQGKQLINKMLINIGAYVYNLLTVSCWSCFALFCLIKIYKS